jgi:hypothetical protein
MNLKIVIASFLFLSFNSLNAQNNVYPEKLSPEPPRILYQKDIYQDSSSLIAFQQVIHTDSVGVLELKKRFKNWGAKQFVNLSQVIVSETDDQMVLVYVVNVPWVVKSAAFGTYSSKIGWYVRLVANFKDDRVRITQTDDGNTGGSGVSARSQRITTWFDRTGKIDPSKNVNRPAYEMVINWRNEILSTLVSCGEGLTQPTSANDDW